MSEKLPGNEEPSQEAFEEKIDTVEWFQDLKATYEKLKNESPAIRAHELYKQAKEGDLDRKLPTNMFLNDSIEKHPDVTLLSALESIIEIEDAVTRGIYGDSRTESES